MDDHPTPDPFYLRVYKTFSHKQGRQGLQTVKISALTDTDEWVKIAAKC